MDDVVYIIGAGIAGLGAAHFVRQQGRIPVVLEATDAVGGRAGAIEHDGVSYEIGGKNFASDWKLFNGILRGFHSLSFDRQHPNFHIVLDGKVYGFDKRSTLTNGLGMMRAIGLRSVLQFNALLRRAGRPGAPVRYFDGSSAALERRYDGRPLSAHVPAGLARGPLRMFTIIMGAAEPDEFSYATLMMLLSSFGKGSHHSLPETTGHLFAHLSQGVEIRRRHEVRRVVLEAGGVKALEGRSPAGAFSIDARAVIVATPLHRLAQIVALSPGAQWAAARIPYHPLALINADYERDVFTPEMNSIMFDPDSPLGHCSANRMHKRHSVRFTLAGRRARSVLAQDDASLLAIAEDAFRRVHPLPGKAVFAHVRRHGDGLCAYGFGYSDSRRSLLAGLKPIQGLAVAGDYLYGHNMEGCLQSAMAATHHLSGAEDAYDRSYDYPDRADSAGAAAAVPTGSDALRSPA